MVIVVPAVPAMTGVVVAVVLVVLAIGTGKYLKWRASWDAFGEVLAGTRQTGHVPLCRFNGCDSNGTTSLPDIGPLCPLHRSAIVAERTSPPAPHRRERASLTDE